jgi:hypothetical protein
LEDFARKTSFKTMLPRQDQVGNFGIPPAPTEMTSYWKGTGYLGNAFDVGDVCGCRDLKWILALIECFLKEDLRGKEYT